MKFDAQPTAVDAPASDANDTNLLTNGSFETSANWPEGWLFQVLSPAGATLTRDTSTTHDGVASAHANVTAVDGTEFHVQLKQQAIAVTAGRDYTYTLWARADGPHSTYLTAQLDDPPYTLFDQVPVDLTTSWQKFSLAFSPQIDDTAMVTIVFGFEIGDYWVDDVRLTEM
jgi:hypothetical protein